jgi:hypothetical protein
MSETAPQARIAAAVSYRPTTAVPDRFTDLPVADTVALTYYELTSVDGRTGLAAHFVPERVEPTAPLVISVHGSGGSIVSPPVRTLSLGLSGRGVPVLSINTRQSGDAVNTDNFYATVRDIEAAYWLARDLGYRRIVLHGHSLGTSQVEFFAATHWHDTTVGVVLTGMFADLPWKSRHLLVNDETTYRELTEQAVDAAQAGDYSRVLATGMPWLGEKTMPVTAEHFLTYRKVGVAGARGIEWIARIPYPILMIRDQHDSVIHDFEPGWLAAALADGISPSVRTVALPSPEGTVGHQFEGSSAALVDTVSDWLADR